MAALADTAGSASTQVEPPCGSRRSSSFNETGPAERLFPSVIGQ